MKTSAATAKRTNSVDAIEAPASSASEPKIPSVANADAESRHSTAPAAW